METKNPTSQKKAPPSPAFQAALKLYEQGKIPEAVAAYQELALKTPQDPSVWLNLGAILRKAEHFEASVSCCKRALELSTSKGSFLTNLGNALISLDRNDEALAAHEEAVRLEPKSFLIRSNYAIALRECGRAEEALPQFDIACGMEPDNDTIKWERALTYLDLARFKEGWEAFEVRWKQKQMKPREYPQPHWKGEDFKDKTILLYEEQGFGDTILCSRFIPMVKARGGRVIFECKPALHRLLQKLPIDKLVATGTTDAGNLGETFDYHLPLMSLPGIFGTDLTNIPPPSPLFASPSPPAEAQRLLDMHKDRFRVGIIWSGSVTFARNGKRAVKAERFLPFAEIPGVQLYSLQKGPCEGELADCGGRGLIPELGPIVNDFADTAAILKQLDLVIMTDSSVAHVAGSVGCPIWNLLCYRPYWLYLSDRSDSPWYPSMRLFRQEVPGEWDQVFKDAYKALEQAVAEKKAGSWPKMGKAA